MNKGIVTKGILLVSVITCIGVSGFALNQMNTANQRNERLDKQIDHLKKEQEEIEAEGKIKDKSIEDLKQVKKELDSEIKKLREEKKEGNFGGELESFDSVRTEANNTSDRNNQTNPSANGVDNTNSKEVKNITQDKNTYTTNSPAEPQEANSTAQEITDYYESVKAATITKKADQVATWKNNNEVNWSDELIANSTQAFIDSFPPVSLFVGFDNDVPVAKARIDKAFNDKFNYSFVK